MKLLMLIVLIGIFSLTKSGSVYFDGSTGCLNVPNLYCDRNDYPQMTWEIWGKFEQKSGWTMLISVEDGGWDRFLAHPGNTNLYTGYGSSGHNWGDLIVWDEWTHLALVFDNNDMWLYKDGVLIDNFTSSISTSQSSAVPLHIGSSAQGGITQQFKGFVGETRIWNVVRTAEQINENMNKNISPQTGLLAYYTFQSIEGSTIPDKSGNGYNANLCSGGSLIVDESESAPIVADPTLYPSRAIVKENTVIRSKRRGTWKAGHPALSAEPCGRVVCKHYGRANDWEHWTMEAHGDAVAFKSHNGMYLTANPNGEVYNSETEVGSWELWTLVDYGDGVAIKSFHGRYLTCEGEGWDTGSWVSANREVVALWEKFLIVFDDDSFTGGVPKAVGYTLVGGLGAVSLGLFALPVLGFTAAGVAAGSAAAAFQSAVYGGATTGLFSVLQFLGATGAYAVYGGVAGAGAVAAAAAAR